MSQTEKLHLDPDVLREILQRTEPALISMTFQCYSCLMDFTFNLLLSAILISFALWVSKSNPVLGGFIISLPLSTLIVLALNQIQNPDSQSSVILAKSIFIGIPSTLLFFIPFLLSDRLKIPFWVCYGTGFLFLGAGYFIHRLVAGFFLK